MSVDYSSLASKLGFEERYVEKVCRVSDLIRRISQGEKTDVMSIFVIVLKGDDNL
jgi:hypothetical protein